MAFRLRSVLGIFELESAGKVLGLSSLVFSIFMTFYMSALLLAFGSSLLGADLIFSFVPDLKKGLSHSELEHGRNMSIVLLMMFAGLAHASFLLLRGSCQHKSSQVLPGMVVAVIIAAVVAILVMMDYLDLVGLAITSAINFILFSLWMKLKKLEAANKVAKDATKPPPECQ